MEHFSVSYYENSAYGNLINVFFTGRIKILGLYERAFGKSESKTST